MTEDEWRSKPGYSDVVPTPSVVDCFMLAAPPEPLMYKVYEHVYAVPPEEQPDLFLEPHEFKIPADDDRAYYIARFPTVQQYAKRKLEAIQGGYVPGSENPKLRMKHFFIEYIVPLPELDRCEPYDEAHIFDNEEERQITERRRAKEKEKYDALIASNRIDNEPAPLRQTPTGPNSFLEYVASVKNFKATNELYQDYINTKTSRPSEEPLPKSKRVAKQSFITQFARTPSGGRVYLDDDDDAR